MDFKTKTSIEDSFSRVGQLIKSGIFFRKNYANIFIKSAFIELIILLHDLVHKSRMIAYKRINFDDDIEKANKVNDITDAITKIRDAVCHIESGNRTVEGTSVISEFNIMYGKCRLMNIGPTSDYTDDICFCYGSHKLYLNRHIRRALEEARTNLTPLMKVTESA